MKHEQSLSRRLHHLEIQHMENASDERNAAASRECADAYLRSVQPEGWRVVPIGSQIPSRRKWDAAPFPDTQFDPLAPIHARRPSRGRQLFGLLLAAAVIGLCYAFSCN